MINKFGHTIEFEVSPYNISPNSPDESVGCDTLSNWVKFNDGIWRICSDTRIDDCDTIEEMLDVLFVFKESYKNDVLKELRDKKIDDLLD